MSSFALRTALRAARVVARPSVLAPRSLLPSISAPSTRFTQLSRTQTYATSTTPTSSSFDPQEAAAQDALDEGTAALELGDLEEAAKCYQKSLEVKPTAIGHYNLGVVQWQQQDLDTSIASFLASISLAPSVPTPTSITLLVDTHQNLGAAYSLSVPPRPDLALEHLQQALELNPDDGEVAYNIGAVLEVTGEEEEALVAFERASKLGITRALDKMRNVEAKLLEKKLKEEEEEGKNPKKVGEGSLHKTEE